MEAESQDSFGLLENEVILAMSRSELNDLRLFASLAVHHLHPSQSAIADTLLAATDDI